MPHISHIYVLPPVYIYSFYTHYNSCTQLTGRSSHNSGLQLGLFRLLCAVLQVSDLYVEVFVGPPKTARERDEMFRVIFRKQLPRLSLGAPGCISRLHVTNNGAHTWYTQIEGRRLFFLFAPQETSNLAEDGREKSGNLWGSFCKVER